MGGGGAHNQLSYIRPLKNQISDPQQKYQISRVCKNQISGLGVERDKIIDPLKYQTPPPPDITCSQKSDIWLKEIRYQTPKNNYQGVGLGGGNLFGRR